MGRKPHRWLAGGATLKVRAWIGIFVDVWHLAEVPGSGALGPATSYNRERGSKLNYLIISFLELDMYNAVQL
jgi:hypothetical protein